VKRCPVILVSEVGSCAIEHKCFCNKEAFLWILREKIHHKVQDSLAIVIRFVNISPFFYQGLYQPDFQFDNCQMQGRSKHAPS
jgi:hypothetical protein